MAKFEKYTEAIYTTPETLHSSNNQRSQSKKTDLVDSNTNDAFYPNCWLHLHLSIVLDSAYKSTRPDATD